MPTLKKSNETYRISRETSPVLWSPPPVSCKGTVEGGQATLRRLDESGWGHCGSNGEVISRHQVTARS